jgi:hypothetical protein
LKRSRRDASIADPQEYVRYFEDMAEVADEGHAEFPDVHDLGDRVLALGRVRLRFSGGVELDQEMALLARWRNRRCVDARVLLSHAEALEAVGLRE